MQNILPFYIKVLERRLKAPGIESPTFAVAVQEVQYSSMSVWFIKNVLFWYAFYRMAPVIGLALFLLTVM